MNISALRIHLVPFAPPPPLGGPGWGRLADARNGGHGSDDVAAARRAAGYPHDAQRGVAWDQGSETFEVTGFLMD